MNNAELYNKIDHLYPQRVTAEALQEFAPRLCWRDAGSGDEAVLDVGCGPGAVTASLLPLLPARVRRVVGADLAPEMVRFAQTTHAHADPRLRFVQADIADGERCVPLLRREAGADGFSKIFSFFCLHWVQDQRSALANIHQLLKTRGQALLLFLAKSPFFSNFEDLSRDSKWQPYMTDVSEFVCPYQHADDPGNDFSHLLVDVGLHAIDCRWVHKYQDFHDMELLKEFLVSVNPFMDRIPETSKQEFETETVNEFLRQKQVTIMNRKTDNRRIRFHYSLLIALVEKKED